MGISDFINKSESRVEKFRKLKKGRTKEQVRDLERKLLKPEGDPEYVGNKPGVGSVKERTVTIIFETLEEVELLKNHFKVSSYQGQNIRGMALGSFVAFLQALEDGRIKYDEQTKRLLTPTEDGAEWLPI